VTFCPQEAPENFLALTGPDCQQLFSDQLTPLVPRLRPNLIKHGKETRPGVAPLIEGRQA
jgi:hypothetical protein